MVRTVLFFLFTSVASDCFYPPFSPEPNSGAFFCTEYKTSSCCTVIFILLNSQSNFSSAVQLTEGFIQNRLSNGPFASSLCFILWRNFTCAYACGYNQEFYVTIISGVITA